MSLNRRNFLKIAAATATGAIVGTSSTAVASSAKTKDFGNSVSMLNDCVNCVGCRACMTACKNYKDELDLKDPRMLYSSGDGTTLSADEGQGTSNTVRVSDRDYFGQHIKDEKARNILRDKLDKEIIIDKNGKKVPFTKAFDVPHSLDSDHYTVIKAYDKGKRGSFIKRQCMHCNSPACVSACPVAAFTKNPMSDPKAPGVVTYDKTKCIGCRYCMIACPFDVPTFEYDEALPVVRKCTFCEPRLRAGKASTQCSTACQGDAIKFGTRAQILAEAKRRIEKAPDKYQSEIYGKTEVGGTSVLYLAHKDLDKDPKKAFKKLGLGAFGDQAVNETPESIMHGTFNTGFLFAIPLAFLGALGATTFLTRKKEDS